MTFKIERGGPVGYMSNSGSFVSDTVAVIHTISRIEPWQQGVINNSAGVKLNVASGTGCDIKDCKSVKLPRQLVNHGQGIPSAEKTCDP